MIVSSLIESGYTPEEAVYYYDNHYDYPHLNDLDNIIVNMKNNGVPLLTTEELDV